MSLCKICECEHIILHARSYWGIAFNYLLFQSCQSLSRIAWETNLCHAPWWTEGCRQLAPDNQQGYLARWIAPPFSSPRFANPAHPLVRLLHKLLYPPPLPIRALQLLPAPYSLMLAVAMRSSNCPLGKTKAFYYLLLYSCKCNKDRMSQRYLTEQLFHVTTDFRSFVAFSFPLCYSYVKPTHATGLKTDCKQPEQRLSHLVCTRPTTMEPLSRLQTFSTAIIQILLIMIANVD